tara:strand:- start:34 stop:138 length:105 start_codon:yes stop_codon:yes gene_type:complete
MYLFAQTLAIIAIRSIYLPLVAYGFELKDPRSEN